MKNNKFVRIFCMVLAVVLVVTMFTGVVGSLILSTSASSSTRTVVSLEKITGGSGALKGGDTFNAVINTNFKDFSLKVNEDKVVLKKTDNEFTADKNLKATSKSEIEIYANEDNSYTLKLVNFESAGKGINSDARYSIKVTSKEKLEALGYNDGAEYSINGIYFPEDVLKGDTPTTDPTTGETKEFSPMPTVESVYVNAKDGTRINEVDEKTDPFSLVVVFRDPALEEIDFDDIPDKGLTAFMKGEHGFSSKRDVLSGEITKLVSSSDGVPRFQIVFRDLTFNKEDGGNHVEIDAFYQMDGTTIKSSMTVIVKQAKVVEEKDDDKDKIAPLKPYVIVNQYSYGTDEIVAGSSFNLTLSYTNTSSDIPLENIVMTVTTPEDLSISSSSNTVYIPYLAPKATQSHTVQLRALPAAKIGSAVVTVGFTYQYLDTENKKREEVTDSKEDIAIPITQIDRFAIDPITEISDSATTGEPFYVTVSFINRGKSPTYNISARAESKTNIVSASQHFGNLEAGKSDSIELAVTCNEVGELVGDIVVEYEDENTNHKELKSSFSIFVDEPYVPEMDPSEMEGMGEMEEPEKISTTTLVLCIIGALFIAAPIGYFFVKRSKQAESEDFYADF